MRFFSALLLTLFCLTACNSPGRVEDWKQWKQSNGKIKVLTTTAMIADLVVQIGQEHVDVLALIKGELDPHSYQLVKGDDEKFSFADLVFFNGLGLEHGPSLQQQLYHTSKAIGLGDRLLQVHPEKILHYKNQIDPHIWMDINLWTETIPFIVAELSRQDPAHAEDYQKNSQDLATKLFTAHQETYALLTAIPAENRYLVTSHDAFNYFTRAYLSTPIEILEDTWHARFAAPEGLAPESQLSAADIQAIILHLAKYRIHVVFPESNVSKDSIRKIVQAAKEKGLNVHIAEAYLYADSMGKPGSDGDSYVKMIAHNAKAIALHLSQEKNHNDE